MWFVQLDPLRAQRTRNDGKISSCCLFLFSREARSGHFISFFFFEILLHNIMHLIKIKMILMPLMNWPCDSVPSFFNISFPVSIVSLLVRHHWPLLWSSRVLLGAVSLPWQFLSSWIAHKDIINENVTKIQTNSCQSTWLSCIMAVIIFILG